ncbi:hypothetical protein [Nocardia grenadensis]
MFRRGVIEADGLASSDGLASAADSRPGIHPRHRDPMVLLTLVTALAVVVDIAPARR